MAELNGTVHTAEMAEGEKSQFDVLIDGKLAFSKQTVRRYPDLSEILALLG